MAASCGQKVQYSDIFSSRKCGSAGKMIRRKDGCWGSLVLVPQCTFLGFLLFAVVAYGNGLCGAESELVNCTIPEDRQWGQQGKSVCRDKATNTTCCIEMEIKLVKSLELVLTMGQRERVVLTAPASDFSANISLQFVKEDSVWIRVFSQGSTIKYMSETGIGLNISLEGGMILIKNSQYQDGMFMLDDPAGQREMKNYCLLRCKGGNCPDPGTPVVGPGWDVFQHRVQDGEVFTYVVRGNDSFIRLAKEAWEVYRIRMFKSKGCMDDNCQLCSEGTGSATSLMQQFNLLPGNIRAFNPCYLFPVVPSVKCIARSTGNGVCLQLEELNLTAVKINAKLSSTLTSIPLLETLILSETQLSGSFSALKNFSDLTYLDLRNNRLEALDAGEQMPKLARLNLANNELETLNLNGLTGLRELSLMNNTKLDDDFETQFGGRNLMLDIRLNDFVGNVPESMLGTTWFRPGNCRLTGEENVFEEWELAPFGLRTESDHNPCVSPRKKAIGWVIAAAVIGALLLGCVTFGIIFVLLARKPRCKDPSSLPRSNSSHEGTGFLRRQKLHDVGFPREFSIREIETATECNTTTCLGKGAFGDVFDATLDGSRVVIKFRAKGTTSMLQDFPKEVKKLGSYNHKHLVRIVGFCDDKEYQALVIEWLPNGSLEYHLYGSRADTVLDWRSRLKILAGAASGIEYLHGGGYGRYTVPTLVHCDIKSSNILLDDNFEARVADYGYFKPKLFGDKLHSDLRYFQGYLDPEYLSSEQKIELDKKSDVFSFGIVILETVSGRQPIDTFGTQEPMTVTQWATSLKNAGNLKDIIDPRLPEGSYSFDVVKSVVDMALLCVDVNASPRPSIKVVRKNLEEAYRTESRLVGSSANLELPSLEVQTPANS